ncbi:hypothetical protein AB4Y32_24110 [Paraburkholderia phymatum]|uniref:Uncharacterized protein n=1 Tax=Paraburkholderia phymatum TaxID=148447 RepID=A0ACC6U5T8_9BURK
MKTKHTDIEAFEAVANAFGHTPETVEAKAAQINLALSAGDSVMAAAVVFDQAKDCGVPKTEHYSQADDVFPYPDLAPFGNHGLAQFMEALEHLGMQLVVQPIAK